MISALLAALAFGACGADAPSDEAPSDEAQIADAANAWAKATATGDGEAACSLMTAYGQKAMTDPYDGLGPNRPPVAATCEKAVPKLAKLYPEDTKDAGIGPEDVTVAGDRAVAQTGSGFCTFFERTNDEWLLAYLPLPGPNDPDASGEVPRCKPADVG